MVVFDDWAKMMNAWRFLKTRAETDEVGGVELVRARDSFARAWAGVRCAEMVFKIKGYLANYPFP